MATVQLEYPAGGIIEKVAIVSNGDDGTWVLLQEALQPGYTFRIKMIGWLV